MNEKEKLIPQRRFKEFKNTGTWEQRKLGDMVEFFSGLTYSPDNVIKQPGTLVLRSSNVQNGEIVNADNVYVDNEVVNSDNVQVGDIAVVVRNGSRSLIGKHAAIKYPMKDTVIGAFMTGVRSDTPSFTNALLDTQQFETEIAKNLGATINQITTGNFKKMIFNFPEIDERLRIGDFFNQLDNTIALHQRKLEKSKALKSAYLSEMFPAEGERKPKRRFAGFTDDWEQRKLGDITEIITKGTTPLDKSWKGPINYVKTDSIDSQFGHIIVKANTSIEEHEGYLKRSQLKDGDVLFSIVGTLGRVGIVQKKDLPANTNQQIAIIRLNKGDKNYVFNALKTSKVAEFIKSAATIGAQPSLSLWQIEKLIISYPSIKEQIQIGKFFNQLDNTIALHQHKLDKLQTIKKAYLNEMFI